MIRWWELWAVLSRLPRRALIPIENRHQFLEVSGDVAVRLDPMKDFGLTLVTAYQGLIIARSVPVLANR